MIVKLNAVRDFRNSSDEKEIEEVITRLRRVKENFLIKLEIIEEILKGNISISNRQSVVVGSLDKDNIEEHLDTFTSLGFGVKGDDYSIGLSWSVNDLSGMYLSPTDELKKIISGEAYVPDRRRVGSENYPEKDSECTSGTDTTRYIIYSLEKRIESLEKEMEELSKQISKSNMHSATFG